MEYTADIATIAGAAGGELIAGSAHALVNTITTDSRDIGNNNLFIPLIGERFDGHQYIEELSRSGSIVGFLTMREGYKNVAVESNVSAILCRDTLSAFGNIASYHRDKIDPTVIGITGTNGKTTTKELVYSMLSTGSNCLKNIKNYNNEVGVPYTLLGLRPGHRYAVIEMGMNHAGELNRLSKISRPDLALITNVGEGHLEFLGSVRNVALAKSEIMNGMKPGSRVFLNADTDEFAALKTRALETGLKIATFGLGANSDIHPDGYRLSADNIELRFRGEEYTIPLFGIHNVYNVLAALAIAGEFGISAEKIRGALLDFRNVDMRSSLIDRGFIIINDSYNSNPLSSRYALSSLAAIFPEKRKIAVLADMKELGENSELYHMEIGRLAAQNRFDILCAYGDMSAKMVEGAREAGMKKENALQFESKKALGDFLVNNITRDDVVLVKGSRSMKMEEIVDILTLVRL